MLANIVDCRWASFLAIALTISYFSPTYGQSTPAPVNAGLEDFAHGKFVGWGFGSDTGANLEAEVSDPSEGKQAAVIDSTQKELVGQGFSNLSQSIDATLFRGKRIRYRATVKTADLEKAARAQLWCRIDCKSSKTGESRIAGFDNMDNRPIRSDTWNQYEIVLDVDPEATTIIFGMFLIGKGRAFLDDVSLEATTSDAKPTGKSLKAQAPAYQMPDAVKKAFAEAEAAPQQSFWTIWLVLPIAALLLFVVGLAPSFAASAATTDSSTRVPSGHDSILRRICFRFTMAYWILYCFPSLVGYVPFAGGILGQSYESIHSKLVGWTARSVIGIERELVPPNGSGDTTQNYVSCLVILCLACLTTFVWTIVDRRKTNYPVSRDLLWVGLRYYLGFFMVVYGLAKLSFEFSQFPPPQPFQLDKTWGDSSPMNVLWSFMGYSRTYTFFSGLGELLAGVLLVWRRTATLGALVAAGVMLNVVMLNFSYDVPVKLMSTHLLVAASLIALTDSVRLLQTLVLNRPTTAANLIGPWTAPGAWWAKSVIKILVILWCIAIPIVSKSVSLATEIQRMEQPTEGDFRLKYRLTKRGFRWVNEVPFNR